MSDDGWKSELGAIILRDESHDPDSPEVARRLEEFEAAGLIAHLAPTLDEGIDELMRRGLRKIVWIDPAVRFLDPSWPRRLARALDRWPLVQPFSHIRVDEGAPPERRPGTIQHVRDTGQLVLPRMSARTAWAARADLLEGVRRAGRGIPGGPDILLAAAAYHHRGNPARTRLWRHLVTRLKLDRPGQEAFLKWARPLGRVVRGRAGTIRGDIEIAGTATPVARARHTYPVKEVHFPQTRAPGTPLKIFQIGFNKCGTSTLDAFFAGNGLRCVHWADGVLAIHFMENLRSGRKVLDGEFANFDFYSDMFYLGPHSLLEPYKFFDVIDLQYPGSKFILNFRDREAWIRSRERHFDLEKRYRRLTGLDAAGVRDYWREEWDLHMARVRSYFRGRPQDLLKFDIDSDPPGKICDFLAGHHSLDPRFYGHHNRTEKRHP